MLIIAFALFDQVREMVVKTLKRLDNLPALQGKTLLFIPFLGIAWPQSQFPHSCVGERFIYSQDRSTYFLQQNRQINPWEYINCSQTHECGNWDCDRAIPFLG
jgi:hypothetical protein